MIAFALALSAAAAEIGRDEIVGVGIIAGNPTGLTGRLYVRGPVHSFEAAAAVDLWGPRRGRGTVWVVYVNRPAILVRRPLYELAWHVGLGPQAWMGLAPDREPLAFGGRLPLGLELSLWDHPVQLTADVAAVVSAAPELSYGMDANIAARLFF